MGNQTKVTTATIAAAIGTLLVWTLALLGVLVPPGVEGAIVVIVTALITWLAPSAREKGDHAA